jgi:hypothetical protein
MELEHYLIDMDGVLVLHVTSPLRRRFRRRTGETGLSR